MVLSRHISLGYTSIYPSGPWVKKVFGTISLSFETEMQFLWFSDAAKIDLFQLICLSSFTCLKRLSVYPSLPKSGLCLFLFCQPLIGIFSFAKVFDLPLRKRPKTRKSLRVREQNTTFILWRIWKLLPLFCGHCFPILHVWTSSLKVFFWQINFGWRL